MFLSLLLLFLQVDYIFLFLYYSFPIFLNNFLLEVLAFELVVVLLFVYYQS